MKQKILTVGLVLLLYVSLCVPALAALEGNAKSLPMMPDFSFSSGVGGWSTECTVHTDGTFEGSYHDSDMGDIGDEYPNGTVYISTFSGAFDHITQVDSYTWSMKVANLNTEDTPGREWIEDGVRYIAEGAVGLPAIGGEVLLYLPGHDRASLPESFLQWTMYSGSGDTSTPQIDYFGLFNVEDEFGFGSYLEDSQIAQAMQERIAAGDPQRLMELVAYYGDTDACKMSASQARAFAQVIEEQTAQLYQIQNEYGIDYGYITSYAALFDLGNGVPALFFAGGATTWDQEREDGCFWGNVGTFGIWLYENEKVMEYEPPHSGMTLALFPSALFVGGYQGTDGSFYDGRVYPIRDGAIASNPDLIAQAYPERETYFLNDSEIGAEEFWAFLEQWGEDLALAGHDYGGGVEGNIWGMCPMGKMLTVLDAYAGAVSAVDMPVSSQPPEDAGVPDQSEVPDSPVPAPPVPEKDEDQGEIASIVPGVVIAAAVAAAIAVIVVLIQKKKTADTVRAGSVLPAADGMPNTTPVQTQTPEPTRVNQNAQFPRPRQEFNFCPQCGSKVQAGDHFCAKCGKPLN